MSLEIKGLILRALKGQVLSDHERHGLHVIYLDLDLSFVDLKLS